MSRWIRFFSWIACTLDNYRRISLGDGEIGTSTHHLLANHDYSFDCELPVAVVEQVLQARPEQVDDQNVMHVLPAEVIGIRNPRCVMLV